MKTYVTVAEVNRWLKVARSTGRQMYIEIGGGSRRPIDKARRGPHGLYLHLVDEDSWINLGIYDKIIVA